MISLIEDPYACGGLVLLFIVAAGLLCWHLVRPAPPVDDEIDRGLRYLGRLLKEVQVSQKQMRYLSDEITVRRLLIRTVGLLSEYRRIHGMSLREREEYERVARQTTQIFAETVVRGLRSDDLTADWRPIERVAIDLFSRGTLMGLGFEPTNPPETCWNSLPARVIDLGRDVLCYGLPGPRLPNALGPRLLDDWEKAQLAQSIAKALPGGLLPAA